MNKFHTFCLYTLRSRTTGRARFAFFRINDIQTNGDGAYRDKVTGIGLHLMWFGVSVAKLVNLKHPLD